MVRESCCPPGALGAMNEAKDKLQRPLRGSVISLEDRSNKRSSMPCYQVGPSEQPKQLVFVFSDVHGVETGNHKKFCDTLQERLGDTTAVWMPDLFRGYPMAPDVAEKTYLVDLICRLSIIWAEKTRITVPAVRADLEDILQPNIPPSVKSVGMVGFCFGAWVIGRAMGWSNNTQEPEFLPNLNAGVLIHPSWRPEGVAVGGGQTKEEMARLIGTKPILFMPGKQDVDFHKSSPIPQQLATQRNVSIDDVLADFTHMDHGWVSRADSSHDTNLQQAQEEAMQQTASFLKTHLSIS